MKSKSAVTFDHHAVFELDKGLLEGVDQRLSTESWIGVGGGGNNGCTNPVVCSVNVPCIDVLCPNIDVLC